jgi:hypothetical protein
MEEQISHPYETIGTIIILYILMLRFLDVRKKDKRFGTEWKHPVHFPAVS